ncbi:uncharacterized protein [Littorina saxatilis]|uniref:uncharacterized protein n=1 Tax=Littorina saxatilis TaxID=31220 RepID=UPI0038B44CC1
MSLLSCLMYVVANVVWFAMVWIFHRARHRQQLIRRQQHNSNLDQQFLTSVVGGPSRHIMHSSIFSMFGLHENRTFFSFEDHFSSFEEVAEACKRAGLDKCQLILGVDFSASNEWQGRKTFNSQCLHKVVAGKILNPYQKVISTIGRTLEGFDTDNYIPTFGFADKETKSDKVFSFTRESRGCRGFREVLQRYDRVVAKVTLGGPTNFAPIIREAIRIVREKKSYHILIIIADGQVTEYAPTVEAIVEACTVPLSIVVVGVGDGPWDAMEMFDNRLPQRLFDNFQFVNFHKVTAKKKNPDLSLALHMMMEIPDQYKTIKSMGYLDIPPDEDKRDLAGSSGVAQNGEARRRAPSTELNMSLVGGKSDFGTPERINSES